MPVPTSQNGSVQEVASSGGATSSAAVVSKAAGREERQARPLIYLACPYSHEFRSVRVARFHAANAAAAKLMGEGHYVFSPISHTHPIAEAGGLPLGWEFWEGFDRAFLSISYRLIVLTVDGWADSAGVRAEIAIAAEISIAVEYMAPISAAERKAV